MGTLVQLLVSGLSTGGIYAAVALGFTLTWRAAAVINFAQGDVVMIGAFIGLTLFVFLHWPFLLAFVGAFILAGVLGSVVERVMLRPVRNAEVWTTVVVTVGLSILLQNAARIIWGPQPFRFPAVFGEEPMHLAGIAIIPQSVGVLVIAVSLMLLQELFFHRTMTGKAMRAVAQDRQTASLMAINPDRMINLTFAVSFGIAAIAGILIAPTYFASFSMGLPISIRAFAAAIIGGFGSVRGSIAGGLFLGVAESLSAGYLSSTYEDAIVFGLVILVLLIRPVGLFVTETD